MKHLKVFMGLDHCYTYKFYTKFSCKSTDGDGATLIVFSAE
jgi:hypothetical protein